MKAIVKEPIFNKKEGKTYIENEPIELSDEEYSKLLAKKAIMPIKNQNTDEETSNNDEQPKTKNKKANKKEEN